MLSTLVSRFVRGAQKDPKNATDPRWLDRLARAASQAIEESNVALHGPVAPYTLEARAMLLGADAESERVPVEFPRPVLIVAFHPSIVISGTGNTDPTLDDIDVAIDINHELKATSAEGVATTSGGRAGQFVTLSNYEVSTPRLVHLCLTAPKPNLGITYRWKQAAGTYNDAMISLACFYRFLG